MLVLNLFLSTVSPVGEVVMQDYWMRFLKLKEGVCVLGYNPANISWTSVATLCTYSVTMIKKNVKAIFPACKNWLNFASEVSLKLKF